MEAHQRVCWQILGWADTSLSQGHGSQTLRSTINQTGSGLLLHDLLNYARECCTTGSRVPHNRLASSHVHGISMYVCACPYAAFTTPACSACCSRRRINGTREFLAVALREGVTLHVDGTVASLYEWLSCSVVNQILPQLSTAIVVGQ